MVNLVWYLRDRFAHLLDLDQRGIETLEWILIGAIVCGVAATTYSLLEGGLASSRVRCHKARKPCFGTVNAAWTALPGAQPKRRQL
jgi:hypothetical protein